MLKKLFTAFAPAEKVGIEEIMRENEVLWKSPIIKTIIDSTPDIMVIINSQRQIVLANDKLLNLLGIKDEKEILGKRPGEAINCIHCSETEGGCGTTNFCEYCGAVNAILNSQTGHKKCVEECRINVKDGENNTAALNLRAWTSPFDFEGEKFTIFAVRDITDEKFRQFLERIFFHDILNMAGGLQGIMEIIPDLSQEDLNMFHKEGLLLSGQLIGEIESQRSLIAAERGEIKVNLEDINVSDFISSICTLYRNHKVAEGKKINFSPDGINITIRSDQVLLGRVLGNLIKNALEASDEGQTVTVKYKHTEKGFELSVHNPKEMPEAVKMQVFNRSFSTKAEAGRGLGTYSVKLLTEKYLKGKVGFTSTSEGTTFTVVLPEL